MNPVYFAILLAGGLGQRFGGKVPKCFATINNQSLLEICYQTVTSINCFKQIFIALPAGYESCQLAPKLKESKAVIYSGGLTRRESVFNGLKKIYQYINENNLDPKDAFCLIHDVARVFASKDIFLRTIEAVKDKLAVTTAIASVDSLKLVDEDKKVVKSLDRNKIFLIQTPQAFSFELIYEAHRSWQENLEKLGEPSDDAMMVELDASVYVIDGEVENRKVTFKEDIG